MSIVSQKRRKASLPEYFPTSSRYVLAKVTSAKNSVKSIPEELAEQQSREHYPIEKNNKNQRKESGASAQTSASGAQTFYPYDYFKPLYEPSLKPKRFTGLRNTFETNKGGLISEDIFTLVPFSKMR